MATTNLNIRIDQDVKVAAEDIFEQLGINTRTAINMFLRQTIREKGIPFKLTLHVPNETTLESFEEGKRILADQSYDGYKSIPDLKNALKISN